MIRILLSARLGERRMTQAEFAQKTGIRPATVSHMYNEYFCDRISLQQLSSMCDVLHCEVGDILKYVPDSEAGNQLF